MIEICIAENIHEQLVPELVNWEKVRQEIEGHTNNAILQTAHISVRDKLQYAHMHLTILNETYNKHTFGTFFITRAMFENVIVNLASSLEAFAHFINQLYNLQINPNRVTIDHIHSKYKSCCLRCKLNHENKQLAEYLDCELVRKSNPVEGWYESLVQYRHQIVHRTFFIINQTVDGSYLPDDPSILRLKEKIYFDKEKNRIIIPNYTEKREISKYTTFLFDMVLDKIEKSYGFIN